MIVLKTDLIPVPLLSTASKSVKWEVAIDLERLLCGLLVVERTPEKHGSVHRPLRYKYNVENVTIQSLQSIIVLQKFLSPPGWFSYKRVRLMTW